MIRPAPLGKQTGDRVDPGDLERCLGVERRQDAGQSSREHRLADPRRPGEEEVVPARGGDLQHAPGSTLSTHVPEIGRLGNGRGPRGQRLWWSALAAEVRHRLDQVVDRDGFDAGERYLGAGLGGADETGGAVAARSLGRDERSGDGTEPAVEGELSDRGVPCQRSLRKLARRGEDGERDRKIESRALLPQIGGREVDRDPPERPLELR